MLLNEINHLIADQFNPFIHYCCKINELIRLLIVPSSDLLITTVLVKEVHNYMKLNKKKKKKKLELAILLNMIQLQTISGKNFTYTKQINYWKRLKKTKNIIRNKIF